MKKWSRTSDACIVCKSADEAHVAKGMCRKCYQRATEKRHNYSKHGDDINTGEVIGLDRETLIDLYWEKELSLSEIAAKAQCTRQNIYYCLKKFGIALRSKTKARSNALTAGKIRTSRQSALGDHEEVTFQKNHFNKLLFKTWSREMAYALGLIITDGNLFYQKAKSGYSFGVLTFGQKDKELVQKLLNILQSNAKIIHHKQRVHSNTVAGELWTFSIGDHELAQDLERLGIHPKKSKTIEFPDVPNEYLRDFLRGVFDGDGSVGINLHSKLSFKFQSGSQKFMLSLIDKMNQLGFTHRALGSGGKRQNSFVVKYSKLVDIERFYHLIFHNTTEQLLYSRKKRIFDDWMSGKRTSEGSK